MKVKMKNENGPISAISEQGDLGLWATEVVTESSKKDDQKDKGTKQN